MKKYLFLLSILLVSCQQGVVYSEFDKIENKRWNNEDVKTFNFIINETQNYTLELHLGHIFDYPIAEFPVLVEIFQNDEQFFSETITVKLKDASGNELSNCTGDICDAFIPIDESQLKAGNYKVSIQNVAKTEQNFLPYILGVGIQVSKTTN